MGVDMWEMTLDRLLKHLLREGDLQITLADGTVRRYGDGKGPKIAVTFHDAALPRKLAFNPDIALGEAYTDGRLTIEDDNLRGLLDVVIHNLAQNDIPAFQRPLFAARVAMRRLAQFNPASRAQKNVAHHYDLSGELYELFLDSDRQYSCAYFQRPDMSLEQAQAAKKAHIARKLRIEPGMRVLDIGCGWGGMALTLARDYGAHVVGVTLSREQLAIASDRARAEGLADKVEFRLTDYRALNEQFDRIVSVGMFEHVGVPHYREYFAKVHNLLTPDGIALIHTIGRSSPPGITSPWITKYIFPGGYVPALSEISAAIEHEDLFTNDVEVWRIHYADTLKHWLERFEANIDKARAIYDDRFCRMWRYYLLACEISFRRNRQAVFQLQLSRRINAVPLTRDYLYAAPDGSAPMRHAAE